MNNKNTQVAPRKTRAAATMVFLILMLFASGGLCAQDKKLVSGTVLDNTGAALPGVTVLESGTTNSTATDDEGKFVIQATPGNSIMLSFIGFKTVTIPVEAATTTVNVTLEEDATMLEGIELVAVGYGTMRKSDLTGAISTVTAENLAKGTLPSTELVLQGKVAGLTVIRGTGDPASGGSLRLRGGTSLTASNSPLVVVDGIAGVDINIVQPQDIKSIDVLKDASATAIYGSRGANGVIIITTKSGNKAFSVNYSGFTGIAQAANNLDLLSANQWRAYVRDNNLTDAVDYGGSTDWQDELQQTAFSQSHSISMSSGSENNGLRATLNYLDNEGIIKTTGLERVGINLSTFQYALDRKLKFDAGIMANIDKWHPLDYRIFERAYNLNPTIPVRMADGKFTSVGGTLYENPVEILTNRTSDSKRHRMLGYFKTEVNLFDGFQAVANMSVEHNAMKGNTYKPSIAVLEGVTENGYAQKTYGEYTNSQFEAYLNYSKLFGRHSVTAMAGYTYFENVYEGFGAQRSGFVTDLFGYNNLGAGYNYRLGDVYSYKGKSNLVSFFGRANYSYDGRYMITGTVRRDGSSRFGENNKWAVFPSVSAAWRLSAEEFMNSTANWLTNFKLRAGYGVTGNQDAIGEYKSLSILGVGQDSFYDPETGTWSLAYSPTQNPNPDLKWESTSQVNIGFDFTFFNRISGSFEWYSKTTKDLLHTYEVPQPPYLVGTMLANVGELSNKGIELTLNANIMKNDKFSWDANMVFAKNKQKIEKLSNDIYETQAIYKGSLHGLAGMSNLDSQILDEGYEVGTFWGPQFQGFDENGEYILSEGPMAIGSVQPDFSLGFGMNFTYNNFDLGFHGYGMFGQKVLNATNMMLHDPNRMPAYNIPDDFVGSTIASPPTFSSYWLEDASFFRLQNVTLGYTVPLKWNNTRLRIYLMGENLAVFTDYSGVDPEIDISGLDAPGIDRFNNYPRPRTYSFGLNLTLN